MLDHRGEEIDFSAEYAEQILEASSTITPELPDSISSDDIFVLNGQPVVRQSVSWSADALESLREIEHRYLTDVGEALFAMSRADMEINAALILPPGALSTDELLGALDKDTPWEADPPPLVDPPRELPHYVWPPEEPGEEGSYVPLEVRYALQVWTEGLVRARLERERDRGFTTVSGS